MVSNPPSSDQIRRLVMMLSTKERLAELAREKGIERAERMTKQELCEAMLR